MVYPATSSSTLTSAGTFDVPFRPATAGLVNVTVIAAGVLAPPPPHSGPDAAPSAAVPTFALRLELFKPGIANPVAHAEGSLHLQPGARDRLVVWIDAMAEAADMGSDWTARVTNLSIGNVICHVTPRFQVAPGNLAKIDHVVVLMLENRSFDHMLGYLRLDGERPDVDGLTGNETNPDAEGNPVPIGKLSTTSFTADPGHGWDDVMVQLAADSANHFNSGFARNFATRLEQEAEQLPPRRETVQDTSALVDGELHVMSFRPALPGRVTVHTAATHPPSTSQSGRLARGVLRRPGRSTPLAVADAPITLDSFGLSFLATADDLATPGNWTFELTNETDVALTFTTQAAYVVALHDTSHQEPVSAIMGYYGADQMWAYDQLVRQFVVCDRWFASLPTDTFPNRLYSLAGTSGGELNTPSGSTVADHPPDYELTTIFETLRPYTDDWRVYFSDLPFALVFGHLARDAFYTERMRPVTEFLDAAATGALPSLSWIDPRFNDIETAIARPDAANDDHPPGDVARGQQFVWQIVDALASGPAWSKTLLLITYDEHGGFYDHVPAPGTFAAPDDPDRPDDDIDALRLYGLRVPAFVVSPWVEPGHVAHDAYDHTSILATILRRFTDPVQSMGKRTNSARDVGPLLSVDLPHLASLTDPVIPPPTDTLQLESVDTSFGRILQRALIGI